MGLRIRTRVGVFLGQSESGRGERARLRGASGLWDDVTFIGEVLVGSGSYKAFASRGAFALVLGRYKKFVVRSGFTYGSVC